MRFQLFLIAFQYLVGVNAELQAAIQAKVKTDNTAPILDNVWHALPGALTWPLIVYRKIQPQPDPE